MQPTSTADRRYQVFISSTFRDLADERKAAVEAVFERGHIPIALERFSPADESDLHVIHKAMASCQVYILIAGHRYGDLVPDRDISFTELEYDLAQQHKLFTLVFLLDDASLHERRRAFDNGNTRDVQEMRNYEKLMRFRRKVTEHSAKPFKPDDPFKYLVEIALSDRLPHCTRPGFVLEPDDPALVEGVRNEFIGTIVAEIRSFEKLYERLEEEKEKKQAAADFFVQRYMNRIFEKNVNLFFESGSTICFVARTMAPALKKTVRLSTDGSPNLQISTNNVLAYLLLWLNARIPCTNFPWSPPVEQRYGAVYGGLEALADQLPDYSLPPLDASAWHEITRLKEMEFSLTKMRKPVLLLGAASGLQISTEPKVVFTDERLPESRKLELIEQLSHCFGPHVGSYHNKIFKRFLYDTGLPMVLFMTSDKIDTEIEVDKCHFILDHEFTWRKFIEEHPIAFCIGTSIETKAADIEKFRNLGFQIHNQNNASYTSAFIARNEPFIREFEQDDRRNAQS